MLSFSAGKRCPGGAQRSGLGMLWVSPGQDGGSSGLGGALTTAPSFHECSKCFVRVQSCPLAMGHGEAVGSATLLTPCGKGSAQDEPRGGPGPPEPLGSFRAQSARLVFLLSPLLPLRPLGATGFCVLLRALCSALRAAASPRAAFPTARPSPSSLRNFYHRLTWCYFLIVSLCLFLSTAAQLCDSRNPLFPACLRA